MKHTFYIFLFLFSPIVLISQNGKKARNDVLALEDMGNRYYEEGHFSLSEQSFLKAKENAKSIGDLDLEIKITGNYTSKFINIRSIAKSIELVLELKERVIALNKDSLLFKVYGMISQQYGTLGTNLEVRKEIADSMLVIAKKINNKAMLRRAYFQLGTAEQGELSIAYYRTCLKFSDWEKDKKFISSVYNNMSLRLRSIGHLDQAIECADSAYIASEETNRLEGMAAARYRAAEAYYFKNEFKKSIKYGKEALTIFQQAGILRRQNNCAHVVSASYKELGEFEKALFYFEMKVSMTDSMNKITQNKEAEFVGRKFQYELAQKRDSTVLAQERNLNKLEMENLTNKLSKERMQKYLLYGGGSIVLIFAIYIWIGFQRKRKDNRLIAQQKLLVEVKNEEILSSIAYAKRIQSAILPPAKLVKEYLKENFILYKPKDVVAGDFYWMEHKDGKVLFAAADCTGHGVPGAMVSVVCNNALYLQQQIVQGMAYLEQWFQ
jgi:tetratricopeptide (TPR) repeat protein